MGAALASTVDVAIIGAGFGGIGAAVSLREAGFHDIAILERADDVGGTWRDNTYPGCACDIPSVLYSFSFDPNPHWSRSYPGQREIWDYLRDCAQRTGVIDDIRFGHDVQRCSWDDAEARWRIETSRGSYSARVLVAASGGLSEPSTPNIPGLGEFTGTVFHSSRWDHSQDLSGRRVAVVGTGASAIQLVPKIAPVVERLYVLQRTPPWILPRHDRPVSARRRRLYERVPTAQRLLRGMTYARLEARAVAFVTAPWLGGAVEAGARRHIEQQVTDPHLGDVLTPHYRLGCKRVLLSDDFYPALTQPNVTVVPHGLKEVRGGTDLVASDGSLMDVDTIIFATGFHATDPPIAERVHGRDGRSLAQVWEGSPHAYLGTTVTGFPNLFLITGPNTGLGHNSIVYMIESQTAYIADALTRMRRHGTAAVDVRGEVMDRFNSEVDRRLARTVWAKGGCASWYQDAGGRVSALWPWYTWRFRGRTRHFDPRDYRLRSVAPSEVAPVAFADFARAARSAI